MAAVPGVQVQGVRVAAVAVEPHAGQLPALRRAELLHEGGELVQLRAAAVAPVQQLQTVGAAELHRLQQ